MMNNRKAGLVQLGAWMRGEIAGQGPEDAAWLAQVEAHNGWFTAEMVCHGNDKGFTLALENGLNQLLGEQ